MVGATATGAGAGAGPSSLPPQAASSVASADRRPTAAARAALAAQGNEGRSCWIVKIIFWASLIIALVVAAARVP
jgi:hypothetical protein